jgi:hypothetical protein
MVAKLKAPYVDRLNPSYGVNADQKKKTAEAFEALNLFVRRHGGAVTSPPGKILRIEVPKNSELPAKLTELGYIVAERGSVSRITGTDYVKPSDELYGSRASPFGEYDVLEIRMDGK